MIPHVCYNVCITSFLCVCVLNSLFFLSHYRPTYRQTIKHQYNIIFITQTHTHTLAHIRLKYQLIFHFSFIVNSRSTGVIYVLQQRPYNFSNPFWLDKNPYNNFTSLLFKCGFIFHSFCLPFYTILMLLMIGIFMNVICLYFGRDLNLLHASNERSEQDEIPNRGHNVTKSQENYRRHIF